jgi:hypothetical protein
VRHLIERVFIKDNQLILYMITTNSNNMPTDDALMEKIELMIAAMEIVRWRRLMEAMAKIPKVSKPQFLFVQNPTPQPSGPTPEPSLYMKQYNTISQALCALHEIENLRARYVRRVHVDPEMVSKVENMFDETMKSIK